MAKPLQKTYIRILICSVLLAVLFFLILAFRLYHKDHSAPDTFLKNKLQSMPIRISKSTQYNIYENTMDAPGLLVTPIDGNKESLNKIVSYLNEKKLKSSISHTDIPTINIEDIGIQKGPLELFGDNVYCIRAEFTDVSKEFFRRQITHLFTPYCEANRISLIQPPIAVLDEQDFNAVLDYNRTIFNALTAHIKTDLKAKNPYDETLTPEDNERIKQLSQEVSTYYSTHPDESIVPTPEMAITAKAGGVRPLIEPFQVSEFLEKTYAELQNAENTGSSFEK